MKVNIQCQPHEFEPGTRFTRVVELIRESVKDEPMIKTIVAKTGHDQIVFILNGRVIRAQEYEATELKEGDDIRWVHPYFGG